MPVFKTFFRIINAARTPLIIYLLIFLGVTYMTSQFYTSPEDTGFTDSKIRIAVINRDGENNIAKGLTEYLSKTSTIVDMPDDTEKLQDALFFRKVEYIAIIPKGFSDSFNKSENSRIETVVVPNSTSAIYLDLIVNRYLQTLRLVGDYSNFTAEKQAELVSKNLAVETDIVMKSRVESNNSEGYTYYFNFFPYVILALATLGISTIMMVFNQPDLKRRNLCSPIKQRSMNIQIGLGSIIYSLFCWAVIVLFGIIIYGESLVLSESLPILALNSLVFTTVCTAIGFLVGILIKSHNVQAAVSNVLSMGMSFLCGVFVPQSLLGSGVLRVASFLPAYWFVKANNIISEIGFDKGRNDVLTAVLIQLGFAIAIFSVALFVSKQKRTANQ